MCFEVGFLSVRVSRLILDPGKGDRRGKGRIHKERRRDEEVKEQLRRDRVR